MEMDPEHSEYFSSYEDLEIHRLMLEDNPRTEAYKNAILNNKDYFKDKVVMDVGCGTGILSIFCAQAGAKKVYAVEASNLADLAREVVKENNFENVIEVIHKKVEDVVLPGNIKVDAIVSEWMGFYLLHEGMLDSVLIARDKFLKIGGEIFPEAASLCIAPCSIPTLHKKWDDFHGVSMSTFAKHLRVSKHSKPEIMTVQPEDILGTSEGFFYIQLNDENYDLEYLSSINYAIVIVASKAGLYQGLCVWFKCQFPDLSKTRQQEVILNTGPQHPATHWKQTVIVLPQEIEVEQGQPIAFQFDMTRDQNSGRRYNIQITMQDPETVEHPLPCSCYMTKCILTKTFMLQHPGKDPLKLAFEKPESGDNPSTQPNIIEEEDIKDDDSDDE